MLRFVAFVAVFSVALVALSVKLGPGAPPAEACTGAIPDLEWLARHADVIVLGKAVAVGDATNHAPTATPAVRTVAAESVTPRPATSPGAPLSSSPTATPSTPDMTAHGVDLTGIGMTLAVERVYAGHPANTLAVDAATRAQIERTMRDEEAGVPYVSSCAMDAFVPRYRADLRYLLFIANTPYPYVVGGFIVDGEDVALNDRSVQTWNIGYLRMAAAIYGRFFQGVPVTEYSPGVDVEIAALRVPLSRMLRAVAFLRGDPSIAPPETGSAGLASGRP